MSIFQKSRLSQPFVFPASESRWLVHCQFDLRQRSWALPAPVIRRDQFLKLIVPADAATLALAVSKTIPNFSDPARGGANPATSASGRIARLPALSRSLGKTQQPKKGKTRLTHLSLAVIMTAALSALTISAPAASLTDRNFLAINPVKAATFLTSQLADASVPVEPVPGPATLAAWAAGIGFFVLLITRPTRP